MTGIIDLLKFNSQDLQEIVAGGHTGFIWSLLVTQGVTYYAYAITIIVYSIQVFSSQDDNERKRKRRGHYKTVSTKRLSFFSFNNNLYQKI